jgi:uncharacterized repeat protein (TIGR03803 family)
MSNSMKVGRWSLGTSRCATSLALALAILAASAMAAAQSAKTPIYTILHKFTGGADGSEPRAGVIGDAAGNIYGTTQIGGPASRNCGTVFKIDPSAIETVLYSFCKTKTDGADPISPVIRDSAGNTYGTTSTGGATRFGTIFKVNKLGKETVLYTFTGGADEAFPESGLIRDAAGNLYGTTFGQFDQGQNGTIFKLDMTGHMTVLLTFNQFNGSFPNDLVRDAAGNFYGSTFAGGALDKGVVFKLDPAGNFRILHDFTGGADGWIPGYGALLLDASGNLFGTTYGGGAFNQGTVFKVDQNGTQTVLYNFKGGTDGASPIAENLVQDGAGNLYGTTTFGGNKACQPPFGCGVVFRLSPSRQETVLHSFAGGASDGSSPVAGLFRDAAGNLFGTTLAGGGTTCSGGSGCGVVFKLTP